MPTPIPVPTGSPPGRAASRLTVVSTDWVRYIVPDDIARVFLVPLGGGARWSYTAAEGAFSAGDTDYNTIPEGVSFEFPVNLTGFSPPVRRIALSHESATGVIEFELYSSPLP